MIKCDSIISANSENLQKHEKKYLQLQISRIAKGLKNALSYLFFFLDEILSWPESDSESELELELLEEELESELESEAWPDPC